MNDRTAVPRQSRWQLVFAINDDYCLPLVVALRSLCLNNPSLVEEMQVTVLHENLGRESAERIRRHADLLGLSVRLSPAPLPDLPYNLGFGGTKAHYLRLAIPELFAGHPRVLYVDADVLVLGDIRPLLTTEMGGLPLGAVRDQTNPTYSRGRAAPGWESLGIPGDREYFNSGVMLVDLEAGAGDLFADALRVVAEHPEVLRLWDQDALNIAAADRWHRLPRTWNTAPFSALRRTPWIRYQAEDLVPMADLVAAEADAVVLHYISPAKPWRGLLPAGRADDIYQEHLTALRAVEHDLVPAPGADHTAGKGSHHG